MEGIGMVTDPRRIVIDVTKKKLNQSSRKWKYLFFPMICDIGLSCLNKRDRMQVDAGACQRGIRRFLGQ